VTSPQELTAVLILFLAFRTDILWFSVHGSPFAVHRLGFEVGSNQFKVRVVGGLPQINCERRTVNRERRTPSGLVR